jgi:hypothetical protein
MLSYRLGRAIAKAVSRRLLITAALVRSHVRLYFFTILYKNSVRTSQEARCVYATTRHLLMSFKGEKKPFAVRTIRNTQTHSVGGMQCFSMLKKVVHTVTIGLLRLLVASFTLLRPGFEPMSVHVGFVVDKVTLGQVSSEYFGFLFQFTFQRLLHTHRHLSSGAGTVDQIVADVPSGLNHTPRN